jgi:hypothetical protein
VGPEGNTGPYAKQVASHLLDRLLGMAPLRHNQSRVDGEGV